MLTREIAFGLSLFLAGACNGPNTSNSGETAGDSGEIAGDSGEIAGDSGEIAGDSGTPQQTASVLQYHNHASRDSVYVDAKFTRAAVANLHVDPTFPGAIIAGPTFAQVLYLVGTGGKPDLVIAATEQNHVYGFNAATGATVWDRALGTPVPKSALGCGNIDPVGVTGTPVIDEATRTIYVDAMTLVGTTPHHIVFALDADTGVPRSNWKVDLNGTVSANGVAFESKTHNQRGALALLGGSVFVPFGGHFGDCGLYHGWVVGISTTNAQQIRAWNTRAIAGGIWAPAGVVSDGKFLFFATGNTQNAANVAAAPGNWGDGEALFRLPPSLVFSGQGRPDSDFFSPMNWRGLDDLDLDISGTAPVLFELSDKAYVMGLGKDAKAYLVDRSNMGGISNPLRAPVVANGGIVTGAASYRTPLGTYVVFRGAGSNCPSGTSGGLTALKIVPGSPPNITTAWCGGPPTTATPAVTMVDAQGSEAMVWIIGDHKLYGLNADTGATIYAGGAASNVVPALSKFQAPILAKGRIFVATNDRVYAFALP